jgi:hypothetical protein
MADERWVADVVSIHSSLKSRDVIAVRTMSDGRVWRVVSFPVSLLSLQAQTNKNKRMTGVDEDFLGVC